MRVSLCCSIFLLFFVACTQDQKSKGQETGLTSNQASVRVSFRCETQRDKETDDPHSQVFLVVNDRSTKIADISACEEILQENYADYQIPANALAACGGWWAGAGDYFYAIALKESIVVMKGWQEEGQKDSGFHYEQASRVPIK